MPWLSRVISLNWRFSCDKADPETFRAFLLVLSSVSSLQTNRKTKNWTANTRLIWTARKNTKWKEIRACWNIRYFQKCVVVSVERITIFSLFCFLLVCKMWRSKLTKHTSRKKAVSNRNTGKQIHESVDKTLQTHDREFYLLMAELELYHWWFKTCFRMLEGQFAASSSQ